MSADAKCLRNLIGRLKEGATAASAQTELNALTVTWSARAGIAPGGGDAGHVFLPPGKGDGHWLQMTPLLSPPSL